MYSNQAEADRRMAELERQRQQMHDDHIRYQARRELRNEMEANRQRFKKDWRNWLLPIWAGGCFTYSIWIATILNPGLGFFWMVGIALLLAYLFVF